MLGANAKLEHDHHLFETGNLLFFEATFRIKPLFIKRIARDISLMT
jgi:hypothetical protein